MNNVLIKWKTDNIFYFKKTLITDHFIFHYIKKNINFELEFFNT